MAQDASPEIRQEKKCDICSRAFARSEHLERHRRTHTKETPFSCPFCRKSFQRSDVKAAHAKKCHAAPNHPSSTEGQPRKRARVACDNCRKRKIRCDGSAPCTQCRNSESACQFITTSFDGVADLATSHNASNDIYQDLRTSSLDSSIDTTSLRSTSQSLHLPTYSLNLTTSSVVDINLLDDNNPTASTELLLDRPTMMPPLLDHSDDLLDPSFAQSDVLFSLSDAGVASGIWQTPAINSQFWFDEPDLAWDDSFFDPNLVIPEHTLPSSLQNMTTVMQEYFDRKSRAPSPTSSKASSMWYSAPPILADHDRDIINSFLSLFQIHIAATFSIFQSTTISSHARAEYILAMAATGGLFCSVPGSAEVAKWMYNDARRLLLATFNFGESNVATTPDRQDLLITVKTFILLELYGLCSGDKRSYEFVEAFHGDLTHAVQQYSRTYQTPAECTESDCGDLSLMESLYLLDCYRVIVMQLPPLLSSHHIENFACSVTYDELTNQLHCFVQQLTDPAQAISSDVSEQFCLASLAALGMYVWPAIHPRQNRLSTENTITGNTSLLKSELVELACDKWLRTFGRIGSPATLAIYHMMNILLHANVSVIQSFAHALPETTMRDPKKSAVAKEVHMWVEDRHFTIARWHAEHLLKSTEQLFASATDKVKTQNVHNSSLVSPTRSGEVPNLPFETPHVPYAVYFATLILWCGEVASRVTSSSNLGRTYIVRGERILSMHKVHIAQLLARVLNEVR